MTNRTEIFDASVVDEGIIDENEQIVVTDELILDPNSMAEWGVRVTYTDERPTREFEVFGNRSRQATVGKEETIEICALDGSEEVLIVVAKNFDRQPAAVARIARFALRRAQNKNESGSEAS